MVSNRKPCVRKVVDDRASWRRNIALKRHSSLEYIAQPTIVLLGARHNRWATRSLPQGRQMLIAVPHGLMSLPRGVPSCSRTSPLERQRTSPFHTPHNLTGSCRCAKSIRGRNGIDNISKVKHASEAINHKAFSDTYFTAHHA